MSEFFTELWESIFTAGTTPTLVYATNATFAALQVLLLALLATTQSVHFVILSALCGGLWWAINWFVREINALKEEDRLKGDRKGDTAGASLADGAAPDSEDTETEEPTRQAKALKRGPSASTAAASHSSVVSASGREETDLAASTGGLSVKSVDSRTRNSTGNVSGTDSEWDKLDSEAE